MFMVNKIDDFQTRQISDLAGCRCIVVVRSACIMRVKPFKDQQRAIKRCAREHGLVVVDTLTLAGVGHRIPDKSMAKLIDRKRNQSDFDAILVADRSRIARFVSDFNVLVSRIEIAGILIIVAQEMEGR